MKTKTGFKTRFSFKLVKWDGDEPGGIDKPEEHPRCVEIVEWELGSTPKTTFRREQWQAD